jgi:hypothetical protein
MKKKRTNTRKVRATALVYTEGEHELVFTRHLVSLYGSGKQYGTKFTVKKGRGGDAVSIVEDALKVPGSFKRILVKLDNDRSQDELRQAIELDSKHKKVQIIFSTPCLEGMLLSILEPTKNFSKKKSPHCKRYFEANYISSDKRTSSQPYKKLFTHKLLQDARKRVPELDDIIKFVER